MKDFNFYKNFLCISMDNPNPKKPDAEIKSDFAMQGKEEYLTNGLIEQMERHPQLAVILTKAAYNYLERNGMPKL